MRDDLQKNVALIIGITKGIIGDQWMRRRVLGGVLVAAVVLLLVGAFAIDEWLAKHIILFLLYWFACIWLTFLAFLMALFEILMVKAASRAELKKAQRQCRPPTRGNRR